MFFKRRRLSRTTGGSAGRAARFVRNGKQSSVKKPHVAIVGTRNASANGKNIARHIALDLVRAGYSVVSGLALGIDGAAHDGALYSADENASTTAVLGTGINVVYPEQNRRIYDAIRQKGVLVSEYALNTKPQPSNFPQRNRIISGLALGLVVIEATLRSGSLITANKALEQGKDVLRFRRRLWIRGRQALII